MIIKESKIWAADNSGAVRLKCIHVYTPQTNQLGNFTKNSLRGFDPKKKLAKKKKYFGLIITDRQRTRRRNGIWVKFSENRALVMTDREKMVGSRMVGPIARELQSKLPEQQFKKISSIADVTI